MYSYAWFAANVALGTLFQRMLCVCVCVCVSVTYMCDRACEQLMSYRNKSCNTCHWFAQRLLSAVDEVS